MDGIRRSIEKQVHQLVGFGSGEVDLDRPAGDQGLFGPASIAWRVHSDFTTMMIGGLSSLMLQMLHPRVLAGVWDHSNFRNDMLGRLRRTAQFVSGTTYGSTQQAMALIDRINAIHSGIHGELPDGTPYSARDPELLTWVHVTSTTSFLKAYIRYRDPWMSSADQDRYLAEMSTIACRMGAPSVPVTRRGSDAYVKAVRPELRVDERTRAVTQALLAARSSRLGVLFFQSVTNKAAIDLLPGWAARMHEFRMTGPERVLVRGSAQGAAVVLRRVLRDGSANRAKRRTAAS
jgi:uncharacterized protein (DUF2236 family)